MIWIVFHWFTTCTRLFIGSLLCIGYCHFSPVILKMVDDLIAYFSCYTHFNAVFNSNRVRVRVRCCCGLKWTSSANIFYELSLKMSKTNHQQIFITSTQVPLLFCFSTIVYYIFSCQRHESTQQPITLWSLIAWCPENTAATIALSSYQSVKGIELLIGKCK